MLRTKNSRSKFLEPILLQQPATTLKKKWWSMIWVVGSTYCASCIVIHHHWMRSVEKKCVIKCNLSCITRTKKCRSLVVFIRNWINVIFIRTMPWHSLPQDIIIWNRFDENIYFVTTSKQKIHHRLHRLHTIWFRISIKFILLYRQMDSHHDILKHACTHNGLHYICFDYMDE